MYVYLKFGPSPLDVKVINNVTIGEDCGPVVNGQLIYDSTKPTANTSGSIDAICWFKALPVQAVYIDCSVKDARWCPKSVMIRDCVPTAQAEKSPPDNAASPATGEEAEAEGPSFIPEGARPLFSEQLGMAGFDPTIDEMYEQVEKLCHQWGALEERGRINSEVGRILHCYVFPAVTFQKEDIPVLQQCLRLIIVKHENTGREIKAQEKHVGTTDGYLARLLEVIFKHQDQLTSQSYLQACDTNFLEVLYIQVIKDVQKRNATLDILQLKINDLKKSNQGAEHLAKLKDERDSLYSAVQRLLTVREAIRNRLYRPFIPKKRSKKQKVKIDEKDASLHTNFQTVYQQLVVDKDHLKQLCYRKLHLSAVREAIESTVKAVEREQPTPFGDFTEFSVSANSEEEQKQSWKSMQARVDGWMGRDSSIHQLHLKGCQLIQDLVEGTLSDARISSMGVSSSCGQEAEADGEVHCGKDDGVFEDVSSQRAPIAGTFEDVSSQRAPIVKEVVERTLQHMWNLAEKIALRLKLDASPESRHVNRAWMCYDPHLWKEAGDAIERVYTHYHAPAARQVHQQASSAALADIMDSRFFQKMFGGGVSATEAEHGEEVSEPEKSRIIGRLKSQNSMSALTLDLQRCSVTDLYALANRDGARLKCHMMDLEELMSSDSRETLHWSCPDDEKKPNQIDGQNVADAEKASRESDSSGESYDIVSVETDSQHAQSRPSSAPGSRVNSADAGSMDCGSDHGQADPASRVNSEDVGSMDLGGSDQCQEGPGVRSSQTVSSVLGIFEAIVKPYHEKVREVLDAPSLMEKMKAVWKSVDFLSKKTQEVCHDRGMDSLVPMSIFATASFSEDLFVQYFIQLLILLDFKPGFTLHSIYDFSLANAISTFMFLFEARFMTRELTAIGKGGSEASKGGRVKTQKRRPPKNLSGNML